MTNKYRYYDKADKWLHTNLKQINTIGELKQYVGKLLMFGYYDSDEDNPIFWMGILHESTFDHLKLDDNASITHLPHHTKDFIMFSYFDAHKPISPDYYPYHKVRTGSSTQTFIYVPDIYYTELYNYCLDYLKDD